VKYIKPGDSEGTVLSWSSRDQLVEWLTGLIIERNRTEESPAASSSKTRPSFGSPEAVFKSDFQGNTIQVFPVEGNEKILSSVVDPYLLEKGGKHFSSRSTLKIPAFKK